MENWKANPEICHQFSSFEWTGDSNFDEDKVLPYTLPDSLSCVDGSYIDTADAWRAKRRPEILELFREYVYGRAPIGKPEAMSYEVFEYESDALDGRAIRKQIRIYFTGKKNGASMDLLLYTPKQCDGPVPVFLGLNFKGNHTVVNDPGIKLAEVWPSGGAEKPSVADEASRGSRSDAWQVELLLKHGYGVATIYSEDLDPDFHDGFQNGVHAAFDSERQADSWGAIGAWAWGLSRALDYLETDAAVDSQRVAVFGHSRMGKAALWAGANDERFALVVSNDSGCGGAALSRRNYGESMQIMQRNFPHWFCENVKEYISEECSLPIDQHMLIALMAPRPIYVASADEDLWADPRGEFLSCKHAEPVYHFLECAGLQTDDMPPLNQSVQQGSIAYHIRRGAHAVLEYDWKCYIDFADKHLK
jgi:hypothetical protein